jgi:hypothetical protein
LPDRKNRLASVKPFPHHLHRFFPHLFTSHEYLQVNVSVGVSINVLAKGSIPEVGHLNASRSPEPNGTESLAITQAIFLN